MVLLVGRAPLVNPPRPSLAERAQLPPILWPEDVAVVLGLPSERAAREFLVKNGVPHSRVGGRLFVLAETLIGFLRDREERRESPEEIAARADETIRQIAPTSRDQRRGRKPPGPRTGRD
jgi:hypothetical protein